MTFSQEDYGRAEREIYKAIEKLEDKVQKAVENEEQSSLNNGKAMANDAKVSQIMQETKNRLAQESTKN